jgi:hypothetical protein
MDITQLILDDHQEQRRLFAILEQIGDRETASLASVWRRLSAALEVHAEAEERHFYPALLSVGVGAGGRRDAADETAHAIKDHNEIRDAVAAVARHAVGSPAWREAVAAANYANSDHMGEEEREGLTDLETGLARAAARARGQIRGVRDSARHRRHPGRQGSRSLRAGARLKRQASSDQ